MKAMVLAAGVGSRLRPLTDARPKALVEVAGRPLVEIVLRRLAAAGVTDAIVNVFHHADQLEGWLRSHDDLGLRIAISREQELLDTGGGIRQAAAFLDGPEPFFVHNADVVSGVDLRGLYDAHVASGARATLAVRERPASRQFLFDGRGWLCGWERTGTEDRQWAVESAEPIVRLAFDGIQVLSPAVLRRLTEPPGPFSMTRTYLRLAAEGERIQAWRADGSYWADAGSIEKLAAIERHVAAHGFPV